MTIFQLRHQNQLKFFPRNGVDESKKKKISLNHLDCHVTEIYALNVASGLIEIHSQACVTSDLHLK